MTSDAAAQSVQRDSNRKSPFSEEFKKFIAQGWAPYPDDAERLPSADFTAERHRKLREQMGSDVLVVPAGPLKVRSNDTDYRFRPHTAFAWLTGLGEDREPDAVFVLADEPILFFRPRAERTDPEFYASARYGELWVGVRDSLEEMQTRVGFTCLHLEGLEAFLQQAERVRVVRDADPEITALVDRLRSLTPKAADEEVTPDVAVDAEVAPPGAVLETEVDQAPAEDDAHQRDDELAQVLGELRLRKDSFEIDEMRRAVDATRIGFQAVARELPHAVANGRGERWIEGVFALHARHLGNGVGYETIAAGGDHATTLHWIRNDGALQAGQLLLLDAGVEVNSLYTADVTRTLPVSGKFTHPQRRVYDVVLAAQQAGIDACKPGAGFLDPHKAAVKVIAEFFEELGILPVSAEESLSPEGGQHRRWMVHGTSHHLGLDVHDCATARAELYRDGTLEEGMIITVEPGIYFKELDELVPEEFRGIGIRIEDDILITADGRENLSQSLPRSAEELEQWMTRIQYEG